MTVKVEDVFKSIQRLLQDDTYTSEILLDLTNQGMAETAGMVLPDFREVLLPELEATDTVATHTTNRFEALPTNYQKKLLTCYSAAQSDLVRIESSYARLLKAYPDGLTDAGNVERVAIRGSNLWYNPKPSTSDTLTIQYFREPTTLDFLDEITELPEQYIIPILKSYCLKEMFTEIEIQNNQPPAQSVKWENVWLGKISEMIYFIGPYDAGPVQVQNTYGMNNRCPI